VRQNFFIADGIAPLSGTFEFFARVMNNRFTITRPFSLLIKPASADCNLRCAYCFFLDKCRLYSGAQKHRMSETPLEHMIRCYMSTLQPVYAFGWQGGQPTHAETMRGIDILKRRGVGFNIMVLVS
jgi:sulfatase maturation enzyme AslB (radical SAM superfamily)